MVKIQNSIKYIEQGETLADLLNDDTPYILYFTASWCGPCRMISPEYEKLKINYPHIDFYKIDIDECEEISSMFNIRSVPTFYLYKKKREYYEKCEGADTQRLSSLLIALNELYSNLNIKEEKLEIKEDITEEEIEPLINDNIVYYNNMYTMGNYEIIEDNITNSNSELNLNLELKDTEQEVTAQTESDLDKFFETINIDTINNTETYDVNPSDLSDINVLKL